MRGDAPLFHVPPLLGHAAFKALGDPVRLRLLSLIASRAGGEVCVCDLTPAFDLSQPTISHHLKLLRQAGLIDCDRLDTVTRDRRSRWSEARAAPSASGWALPSGPSPSEPSS
ncbi:ArsR/SmtB family transcription factor [Streptomyces hawaiiensis]|uniref:ArsR/SmtB family transcription factor n=1 Tax=Streptomyces hawaiiensis TaxID=67305 RepID=UPI00365DB495